MLTTYHLDRPDTGESQVLDGWSYFWGAVGGPIYVFAKGFRLLALAMLEQFVRVWQGHRPLYVVKAEQTLAGDDRHSAGV